MTVIRTSILLLNSSSIVSREQSSNALKKIINTKRRYVKLVELYSKRNMLKEHIVDKHDAKIIKMEQCIAEEACEIIEEDTAGLDCETGGYNSGHLWKLKNKIIPKPIQVTTEKKVKDGTLLSENK